MPRISGQQSVTSKSDFYAYEICTCHIVWGPLAQKIYNLQSRSITEYNIVRRVGLIGGKRSNSKPVYIWGDYSTHRATAWKTLFEQVPINKKIHNIKKIPTEKKHLKESEDAKSPWTDGAKRIQKQEQKDKPRT